jgi:hydrogenase maturation protease
VEVLVLGIGNVLWADEGFGVRAVESLVDRYELPSGVEAVDGGTQGLYLLNGVMDARRLILFDAIDFKLAPGSLHIVRDDDVPAWGSVKMSLHQTHFAELLALARLQGRAPESIVLIGVQPVDLTDFGGSLRPEVKARVPEAVATAVEQLKAWGFAPRERSTEDADSHAAARINAAALAMDRYEAGRPAEDVACRIGDARLLKTRAQRDGFHPPLQGEGWGRWREFAQHAARLLSGLGLQAQARPARGDGSRMVAAKPIPLVGEAARLQARVASAAEGSAFRNPASAPLKGRVKSELR